METKKLCKKCGIEKPLDEMVKSSPSQKTKDGYLYRCLKCRNEYVKNFIYKKRTSIKKKEINLIIEKKVVINPTREQLNFIVENQSGFDDIRKYQDLTQLINKQFFVPKQIPKIFDLKKGIVNAIARHKDIKNLWLVSPKWMYYTGKDMWMNGFIPTYKLEEFVSHKLIKNKTKKERIDIKEKYISKIKKIIAEKDIQLNLF